MAMQSSVDDRFWQMLDQSRAQENKQPWIDPAYRATAEANQRINSGISLTPNPQRTAGIDARRRAMRTGQGTYRGYVRGEPGTYKVTDAEGNVAEFPMTPQMEARRRGLGPGSSLHPSPGRNPLSREAGNENMGITLEYPNKPHDPAREAAGAAYVNAERERQFRETPQGQANTATNENIAESMEDYRFEREAAAFRNGEFRSSDGSINFDSIPPGEFKRWLRKSEEQQELRAIDDMRYEEMMQLVDPSLQPLDSSGIIREHRGPEYPYEGTGYQGMGSDWFNAEGY